MAILTDLPNELLLPVIADVSPLYIESFALTCKRIYHLCTDTLREHDLVRDGLRRDYTMASNTRLLGRIFEDSGLAAYPKVCEFFAGHRNNCHKDLVPEINIQTVESSYTAPLKTTNRHVDTGDLVIPLLITRLLNLRRTKICISLWPSILETVLQIVVASYNPMSSIQEPLPLGRLTEAHVYSLDHSNCGMDLAILLAMIPTLRKLRVFSQSGLGPYVFPHQNYCSGVTDMSLSGYGHLSFSIELISRTHSLQNFTYGYRVTDPAPKLEPRRLAESLKQHAGHCLLYLKLTTEFGQFGQWRDDLCRDQHRNHSNLSLGSLRGFSVLRVLITCVDMFIKTRDHSHHEKGTGTVQRLVAWLPASLETLVLHQGLEKWDRDVLRMLFRGFRNKKQARLPNLKRINFAEFPNFKQLMPNDIQAGCRETGARLGVHVALVQINGLSCTGGATRLGRTPLG